MENLRQGDTRTLRVVWDVKGDASISRQLPGGLVAVRSSSR
jgi:hypothetical protein